MDQPIISVEGLGKKYRLRHQTGERYATLRDTIAAKARSIFRRHSALTSDLRPVTSGGGSATEDFWALKDVSFEIKRGEVVGIIGRNGAGKSTLLKILSRITEPTKGRVTLRGRVASLLEVGTGFHPELTGHENIFLNGAILGMSREEIRRKFDEIVAFAEVEKFLDTPVKRYSSGMYVRLAFAVAAHLEPEILIVDEVLAVGDISFQRKCLGKMQEVGRTGRTVLFVSHNLGALRALCTGAVLIEGGSIAFDGDISQALAAYTFKTSTPQVSVGEQEVRISDTLTLYNLTLNPSRLPSGSSVEFVLTLTSNAENQVRDVSLLFYSRLGVRVAIADLRSPTGPYNVDIHKPLILRGKLVALPFVEGDYDVGVYINAKDYRGNLDAVCVLSVDPSMTPKPVMPYGPHDRGFVELPFTVERQYALP